MIASPQTCLKNALDQVLSHDIYSTKMVVAEKFVVSTEEVEMVDYNQGVKDEV